MRGINVTPGQSLKIANQNVTVTMMGVETRGADPPIVYFSSAHSLRVWDEPQEGAIIGAQAVFVEGSWVRMASQPLKPGGHLRWLGIEFLRVGAVATGNNLLGSVLSFLSQGIPLPRVGEIRLPYAEIASDLVGTFVQYRFSSLVWGEWSGTPGLVEEDRMYGATYMDMRVTLIGHFD